jgi:hypothetical protein
MFDSSFGLKYERPRGVFSKNLRGYVKDIGTPKTVISSQKINPLAARYPKALADVADEKEIVHSRADAAREHAA